MNLILKEFLKKHYLLVPRGLQILVDIQILILLIQTQTRRMTDSLSATPAPPTGGNFFF